MGNHKGIGKHYSPTLCFALTSREQDILALMNRGMTSVRIASILGISPATVKGYRLKINTKIEAQQLNGGPR